MPASDDLRLGEIGQIAIRVRDLDRAMAFYRDRLGLPFLFSFPPLAFLMAGTVRLMLTTAAEGPAFDHPASTLYFRVADIDAAHATLAARGVTFQGPPAIVHRAPDHELWMAFFEDGEDNCHALMCERR